MNRQTNNEQDQRKNERRIHQHRGCRRRCCFRHQYSRFLPPRRRYRHHLSREGVIVDKMGENEQINKRMKGTKRPKRSIYRSLVKAQVT